MVNLSLAMSVSWCNCLSILDSTGVCFTHIFQEGNVTDMIANMDFKMDDFIW